MANIPYTGGTGSTSYSLKSGCESVTVGARSEATWITITSVGNGSINYNVSANAGSERTGYITPTVNGVSCSSNKFSVTQDGVPAPSCTCSDFSITPTSLSWDSDSTSSKNVTITSGSCISNITVNTLAHFNATVGSGKVTVSPKGTNTTTSPYTETLTISYRANGSSCTNKSVSLTQSGQAPVTCTCSDLTASAGGIITATGGGSIQIGTVSYTCVRDVTATTSSELWADNLKISDRIVTANISPNTNTANTRSAYITITGATDTGTCTTGFTITQSKSSTTLSCNDFVVNDWSINSSGSTGSVKVQIGEYDSTVLESGSFSMTNYPSWVRQPEGFMGRILAFVDNYTGTSDRTAQITVTGAVAGNSCTKTYTLTQEKPTCNCVDINLVEGETVPAGGGSNILIGTYDINSCVTGLTVSQNLGEQWIHDISVSNGEIRARIDENRDLNNDRGDYVILSARTPTEDCTAYSLNVSQIRSSTTCSCDSFWIDSTSDFEFDWDKFGSESGAKAHRFSGDTCITVEVTNTNPTDFYAEARTGGISGIVVYPYNSNTSTTQTKNATITFVVKKNGVTCPGKGGTFNVVQKVKACDCENLELHFDDPGARRFDIPSYAVGLYDIGSYRNVDGCLKNLKVWARTDSSDWLSNTYTTGENGLIKGTIANEWTSITQPRETEIYISGTTSSGKECHYSYTLRQCKVYCECSDLTLDSTTASVVVGETTIVGFTRNCSTLVDVWTSDDTIAKPTLDAINDKIKIKGVAAGTAKVILHYNTNESCGKPIDVTVSSPTPTCECTALTVNPASVTVDVGSTASVTFESGCTTGHRASSDDGNIASISRSNNTITVRGVATGSTNITLSYTANTTPCSIKIPVTVVCPTITIEPDNKIGPSSGETVTFRAT